jgi:lysine-ketoglutarate reductase/saccharopine dehydrogenase-like protein (TIGR00300 family)
VKFERVQSAGVAPENYHATTIHPEYFQVRKGEWRLLEDGRMDCAAVLNEDGSLKAVEFRRLQEGDAVAIGRGEDGEDGIVVYMKGFPPEREVQRTVEKFAFRTHITRETSFSIDYDELYDLLSYEREKGFILWVLGPAVVFDSDARQAVVDLVQDGYVHGLLAGNALAVHDIEGAIFKTALGQEIYSKRQVRLGHYNHLDAINTVTREGSIENAVAKGVIRDGVMHALVSRKIPYVLAGSIRDDGPLPDVVTDVRSAQDKMRVLARRATTVIAMATQLHAIASGNMLPAYTLVGGKVRPVYFYVVDITEFAADKLIDRGSLATRSILTNVQDFVVILRRGLQGKASMGTMPSAD